MSEGILEAARLSALGHAEEYIECDAPGSPKGLAHESILSLAAAGEDSDSESEVEGPKPGA
eukprot:6692136-Pyramimonas_sp.AAC.1